MDAAGAALRRGRDDLAARSAALLVDDADQPRAVSSYVGSGVLVAVGDAVLVATAAHNLRVGRDARPAERSAVRVVPGGRYRADPLRVVRLGVPERGEVAGEADIGWVEVDAAAVRRRGLRTLAWSELVAASRVAAHDRSADELTVLGFPAASVPWQHVRGTHFEIASATVAGRRAVCAHRPADLAVAWAAGSLGLHPRGFSGCGVWTTAGGDPVPVALARAWHGGRRLLYCTPIAAWLAWVSAAGRFAVDPTERAAPGR